MKKWKVGILFLLLTLILGVPASAEAATSEQRENCEQLIMEMLYSADTNAKNIYQYRMTKTELDELCAEIRYGEGAEIFGGYYNSVKFSYTYGLLGGYVRTIRLSNVNADALTRYEQMVPVIDSIVSGLEEDMTDLDKLIYLHDVVVETVEYQETTDAMYIASGALVDKQAVCAGYAKALNVLLHRVGIETSYVCGTSLNHGWSYVKLDGQWYHVDPTWDDERASLAGKTARDNLLRNDEEFSKDHGVWEVRVIKESSESSKYEDWIVHDVVGEMRFEDGLWYCLDTNSKTVVAIDAVNNCKEELFSYSYLGSVTLVDVIDNQMILKVNGKEISRTIEEWKLAIEEAVKLKDTTGVLPLDFSDIACWKTGHYDSKSGVYCPNKTRICLNELIENTQEQYTVTLGNENYKVAIREYNARKKIIGSAELGDGEVYVPSEGAIYLGISVFNSVQSKGITFADYEKMFADGFCVGFNLSIEAEAPEHESEELPKVEFTPDIEMVPEVEAVPEEEVMPDAEVMPDVEVVPDVEELPEEEIPDVTDVPVEEVVCPMEFSAITYWKTGHYDSVYGAYCLNKTRICLKDLIENTQGQYTVTIGHEDYKIVIIEYNARKKIIGSAELGNGEVYIPSEGVIYLGISIFNSVQSKGITFADYEKMFADGLVVGFNLGMAE